MCLVEKVRDGSDPAVQKLGVNALPAIVGWLSNGEKHIIKTGISVKDLKSAIQDLSGLLDTCEKKNKKAASAQSKREPSEPEAKQVPLLTGSNFNDICGEKTPLCVIGVFRSSKAKDKLEKVLLSVSHQLYGLSSVIYDSHFLCSLVNNKTDLAVL